MRRCLPRWTVASRRPLRSALFHWLKFLGKFHDRPPSIRWQRWLDEYASFQRSHRALADCTVKATTPVLGRYLAWQFQHRPLRWRAVQAEDLCRYATLQCRTLSPKSVNGTLSSLRQFFRFLHLHGKCSSALAEALPTVADFGRRRVPEVLDEGRRRKLLRSFDRSREQGCRDSAMAVCLSDLGLRACEVRRLRCDDLDWRLKLLRVPPAKAGSGRQLPIPDHVQTALRDYLKLRPSTHAPELFVGQAKLRGRALSSHAIIAVMDRAYRRCGFHGWFGSHRLRHSFASRLFAHGATTKEIADLLGHRLVATTDHYTQANDLRPLSQPWPL